VNSTEDEAELAKRQREAEASRAELSETVGDLREKIADTLSPAAAKREAREYVRESGERLLDTVQRKAFENPLQTVALVGALGYPFWRRLPAIPTLMVGAGLALARMGTQAGAASLRSADLSEAANRTMDRVSGAADDLASRVSERAKVGIDETVSSGAEMAKRAGDELLSAADRYPLLVGGVGLALGAIIGAALPRTSVESELVGDLSEEMQSRAGEIVKTSMEAGKEGAGEVIGEAAREAKKQGLISETSGKAASEDNTVTPGRHHQHTEEVRRSRRERGRR
jgi:hypothetical protein